VVGALEGDQARSPGDEEGGAERDLDRVLAGDAEERSTLLGREPLPERSGDVGLGEIAERVDAPLGLVRDGGRDIRIPVAERGDAEAGRQVEVLAPVGVDDAATLGLGPDHGRRRFSVSRAT
jgi:hypothetical protein